MFGMSFTLIKEANRNKASYYLMKTLLTIQHNKPFNMISFKITTKALK